MKGKDYFPLKLVILYLVFTLFLYVLSPWDFKTVNPFLTFSLLILYLFAFIFGYQYCMKNFKPKKQLIINNSHLMVLIYILLVLNFISLFIQLMRINGFNSFNLDVLWNKIVSSINSPSASYYQTQEVYNSNLMSSFMGKTGTIIILIMRPFSYSILITSAIFFIKLNCFGKFFSILNLLTYLIRYITLGTNKGIIDIVIILFSVLILYYFRGILIIKKKTLIISIILLLSVGLAYFNFNLGDRYFGQNWNKNYYLSNTVSLKENSFILKFTPEYTHSLIASLSSYLGQGYYGFSLSTDVQWTPMMGIGNSQNSVYSKSLKNSQILQNTLQYKAERKFGWIAGLTWSSFYSWVANDVSIYGVPFIMAVFGFLFALAYKDTIYKGNPFASIIFVFLMIEIFFIPANNQISVSVECELSFIFMIILWLLSRRVKIKYE